MNGATHYAFSVIFTILVYMVFSDKWMDNQSWSKKILFQTDTLDFTIGSLIRISFIVVINFFFHAVADALAEFTYHPSESDWGDPVYAAWHIFTYIGEFVLAVYLLRTDLRYAWGMAASVGFDLWEWSIARPLNKYFNITLPGVHHMADDIAQNLLFWAPNWRNVQAALIVEVIVFTLLFFIWFFLSKNWPLPAEFKGSYKAITILVIFFGIWRLMLFL